MKVNEDGTLEEGWISELPEDIREDKTLAEIRDIPSMAKMLVSAQRMVGADKVILPGPDATEEELNAFYTSLGRPESPDGYELEMPQDFPREVPIDETLLNEYKEVAHKTGLQPSQARQLFDWYNERVKQTYERSLMALESAKEEAEKALKEKWGDKFTENHKMALLAVRTFFNEEDIKRLDETGIGNLPWLVEAFAKVGKIIAEDKLASLAPTENATTAQAEIDRIMGDPNHPYHNKKAPGHVEAVHRMHELFKMVYPDK